MEDYFVKVTPLTKEIATPIHVQSTEVTVNGPLTARARLLVERAKRRELGAALIHRHQIMDACATISAMRLNRDLAK